MSLHRQTMNPVSNVFSLPRSDVSLFATGDDNTLGALVWTAKQVEDLHVGERFDTFEHAPTGIPYTVTHHLAGRHEITFGALWNIAARLQRNVEYILVITWQDAGLGAATVKWVRRYYCGVMTSSREISSRDGNEFGSGNTLSAKYFNEVEGGQVGDDNPSPTPPPTTEGDPSCP